VKPTCDGESALRLSVALVLSGVPRLQVLDLQGPVPDADPAPLRLHRAVPEPGEHGLPPPPRPPAGPPLSGLRGAAAGQQQRAARGHPEVTA